MQAWTGEMAGDAKATAGSRQSGLNRSESYKSRIKSGSILFRKTWFHAMMSSRPNFDFLMEAET